MNLIKIEYLKDSNRILKYLKKYNLLGMVFWANTKVKGENCDALKYNSNSKHLRLENEKCSIKHYYICQRINITPSGVEKTTNKAIEDIDYDCYNCEL